MYLFDPGAGVRRRAIMRDKLLYYVRKGMRVTDIIARDLAHRTLGVVAEASHLLQNREFDDDVLIARVRTRLGRLVSHPHAIEVQLSMGRIVLAGAVYGDEVNRLVRAVSRMRGVHGVINELRGHRRAEPLGGLLPDRQTPGQPLDIFQKSWSPATRFLICCSAGFIALYGMRRQDLRGVAVSGLGLLAGLRAITNREARELLQAAPLRGGYRPAHPKAKPRPERRTQPHEIQVAKTRELEPTPATKPKAA